MPNPVPAARQSLRHFLAGLELSGEVRRIVGPVEPRFEISACLGELTYGPAVVFESVAGSPMRVAGNLLNSSARIARGLAATPASLQETIVAAIRAPLASRLVAAGPCQEVAIASPDLAAELPVPWFFEHETGPYITAGAIVTRDSETGKRNLSFARLKLLGGDRAFIGIAPNHHLAVMARAARARGDKLAIAVTIGNHPAVLIAAALYLGLGDDELEVAGALLGEPVEVVRSGGAGLEVPAHCEVVLEGEIDLAETHEEGPVSEFHGMYEQYGAGAVATFGRLTRRSDAFLQVIQPGYHPEHSLVGGVAIAAGVCRRLRDAGLAVKQVAVGHGGCGRLDAVVALAAGEGRARQAMETAWESVSLVKNVTVVDADIDPWDPVQVAWAVATRMKADRDLVVLPGARTDRSEPLKSGGTVAKLGLDATRKPGDREDWSRAAPPAEVVARMCERLRKA